MAQGITSYREVTSKTGYYYRVNYSQTYNIETNKSTVTITSVQAMSKTYYGGAAYLDGTVKINGSEAISVSSFTGGSSTYISSLNTWYTFSNSSGSVTVAHNNDGTKSVELAIALSSGGFNLGDAVDTTTITLTTIPRASTATWSGTTIGSKMSVTVARAASNFTHTCTLSFGSNKLTQTGVTTSTSFDMPLSWCSTIPNSTTGTATLQVLTYSGSTQIGSKSYSITISAPSSVVPTVSASSSGVNQFSGLYLSGKSSVKITLSASGTYGSTIKSYNISGGGYSSSSSTATLGPINSAGNVTFTCTVTDSRGRQGSTKVTINVVAYSRPTIKINECYRCKADGTNSQDGTYILAKVTFTYTALSGKNTVTGSTSYALNTAYAEYKGKTTLQNGVAKAVFDGAIDTTKGYLIKFTAKDDVGETAEAIRIITSSANYLITAMRGKVAINGYVDSSLADGLQVNGYTTHMGNIGFDGSAQTAERQIQFANVLNGESENVHDSMLYGGNPDSDTAIGAWDRQNNRFIWNYTDASNALYLGNSGGSVNVRGTMNITGRTKLKYGFDTYYYSTSDTTEAPFNEWLEARRAELANYECLPIRFRCEKIASAVFVGYLTRLASATYCAVFAWSDNGLMLYKRRGGSGWFASRKIDSTSIGTTP